MKKILKSFGIIAIAAVIVFGIIACDSGGNEKDDRVELTAGSAVNADADDTSADVTFTGASGLTLSTSDFMVTQGTASITGVSIDNGNVTVTVSFDANTAETAKTYIVGISTGSTKIKGNVTVTITQAAAIINDTRVELTAGSDVDTAYNDTSANVTFIGATGLTLSTTDFSVTGGLNITGVTVENDTVTVTVGLSENSYNTENTYTVSINPNSTVIKGSASVTITQAANPGGETDTRVELTAGSDVDVDAADTSADVTFTGASGLTLTAADFAVSGSASIDNVSVSSDTVTVTVNFAANTTASEVTYTVGINSSSEVIKGDASVTITQAAEIISDTTDAGITLQKPEDAGVTLNVTPSVEDLIIYKTGGIDKPTEITFTLTNPPAGNLGLTWIVNGENTGTGESLTIETDNELAIGDYTVYIIVKESEFISWSSTSFTFEIKEN